MSILSLTLFRSIICFRSSVVAGMGRLESKREMGESMSSLSERVEKEWGHASPQWHNHHTQATKESKLPGPKNSLN